LGTVSLSGGKATLSTSTLSVGPHSITATYSGDTNYAGSISSVLTETVNSTSSGGNSAVFVTTDTATQGSWKGVYGANGYNVIDNAISYPGYVTVTPINQLNYIWASNTSDVRGLQVAGSGTGRIAATWYTSSSFTIDLVFNDGLQHQLAVYCVDWDSGGQRAQTLSLLDGSTNAVLDSRTVATF
jgi:hypothetical protein